MNPDWLRNEHAILVRERTQNDPAWLIRLREEAFALFESQGIPTTKLEEWRYTNLSPVERIEFEIANVARAPIVVADAISIRDIVEETHQALNENRPEMRRVPNSRDAVAQELLLFEQSGSDDTEELVDSEYRMTRVNLRVPFVDALLFPEFLEDVRAIIAARLDGRATFELTGLMTLLADIFDAVIVSMGRSYAFAVCVITPLMMLLLGSLRRGLVSMVPNLLPMVAVLAVMGWGDIAIDTTTMMVGAMVIGIVVDDTIHFMHKFHRYFEQTGDLDVAVAETLRTTGSALLFTTMVLMAGFAVCGLSEMTNIRVFGLLSSFAAGVALIADILIAPALLAVVDSFPVDESVYGLRGMAGNQMEWCGELWAQEGPAGDSPSRSLP